MMSQQQPDLSIVIPAYSEEQRIGQTLDSVDLFLKSDEFFKRKAVEVIVVAADALDKTKDIVRHKKGQFTDLDLRILEPGSKVGKGRDVQYGMLNASGKFILFMDADLATPLHHIQQCYELCMSDTVDLVVGTRDLLNYRNNKIRGLLSVVSNFLYQTTGGVAIKDTQCGFKMFTQPAAQLCFSKMTIMGWGFDMEILAIARANKLSVKTVHISDWEDKPYSTHTDNILRIGIRMIGCHIKIVVKTLRGDYTAH